MTMLLEAAGGVSILVGSYVYLRGYRRCRSRGRGPITSLRLVGFGAGLALIVVSLFSPLEEAADTALSTHMVQHVLLFLAPLPLVTARTGTGVLLGLDPALRSRLLAVLRRIRPGVLVMGRRPVAWAVLSGSLVVWHVPAVLQAALVSPFLHAVQHLAVLSSAALWWFSLVGDRPGASRDYGASLLSAFGTMLLGTAVGALLTFSTRPWYPLHAARVAEAGGDWLVDQQLAGLVMWIPTGLVLLVVFAWLGAVWLQTVEGTVRPGRIRS